ncbi:MAG: Hsp20 family protein [Lachnospiraceae bacterium]|nr:Hsp20 family protein [Lachnospiraceae bacterium]
MIPEWGSTACLSNDNFYLGENITPEKVYASFENGLLKLEIPKKPKTREQNDRKYIYIADE